VNALSVAILGPALVAGLLILATHVPLGSIVLRRGIIFIDIALAQVAALGVVFGNMMWGTVWGFWGVQLSALVAALGCAMLLTWTDKNFHSVQEAIIGVVYIVAAALQIVILSYSSNGSEALKDLLIGQILLVTPSQLLVIAVIYAGVFAVWYLRDLFAERRLFYGVLALVITASVQIVGVLLVFSSLIIPVLCTQHAPARWRLLCAYNLGAVSYFVGLLLSAVLDISPGAAIVCTLAIFAVVTAKLIAMLQRSPAPAIAQRAEVKAMQTEVQTRMAQSKAA
jgi:zinc/manganese transport system permease protein